jgi:molybdate transport system substrate-binding protein
MNARAAVAIGFLVLAVGCGSSGGSKEQEALGPVRVFAAASLTEPFTAMKAPLIAKYPGLAVTESFAGSQALVRQVTEGAPADVVAAADERTMQKLVDAGLVDPPVVFARNQLEIVVAPGNPKRITGLAALARPDLVVVLADPSVPVGAYARAALLKANVTAKPKSLELDVKAALAKVTAGEADAAIVYRTDVKAAAGKVAGVAIPAEHNVIATYLVAIVKGTAHRAAAQAFVDELLRGIGRRALEGSGFLGPE